MVGAQAKPSQFLQNHTSGPGPRLELISGWGGALAAILWEPAPGTKSPTWLEVTISTVGVDSGQGQETNYE